MRIYKAVFGLMLWGAVLGAAFSQTEPPRRLSSDIMSNWIANENAITLDLSALEYNSDAPVTARFVKYWRHVELFAEQFLSILDWIDYGTDITVDADLAKAYRKALRIRVPAEVKSVYLQYGLGGEGHQAFMCLTLGWVLFELKQYEADDNPLSNKAQKVLTLLESLIHPQDLALIVEHGEEIY